MPRNKLSFLRNIPITRKLYFIVWTMAVLIAIELGSLWFSIHTLSSVRALVGAEGLWSKAEKDALYQLERYYRTENEDDYRLFMKYMEVPVGDHKTRMELIKAEPDMNIARQGFVEGRVHPDDIDGMISLLRRFHSNHYINGAIKYWTGGDSAITNLITIGTQLHDEISKYGNSTPRADSLLSLLTPINKELTVLEDGFSYTLGEGSRWMENLILKLLFIIALTVEITGLVLSIYVSRSITSDLNDIIRATKKITKGDLSGRAKVNSNDEIGQVATAMNIMTEQLVSSNNELGQFAFIASHDLQEPLRTISNYASLLQEKNKDQLDVQSVKYLETINSATRRMQLLIKDLLDYSRIGHDKTFIRIDTNLLMQEVITDLHLVINENKAQIIYKNLPVIMAFPEIKNIFQNLVSNAVKFKKPGQAPVINIYAKQSGKEWMFTVKDNGIGISSRYFEKIFTIFQKLHPVKEYAGTGIGLAHSKKIVEMHGGRIWVESVENTGSNFYFTIPIIA